MAWTKCLICNTSCVSCKWWRCTWCWFNEEQARLSNDIYSDNVIDLAIPWALQFYRDLIKKSKDKEYILSQLRSYEPQEIDSTTIIIENTIKEKPNAWWFCEYPDWVVSAWDVCIYCWTARFYWQDKPCYWKQ